MKLKRYHRTMHLNEKQLESFDPSCPLCKSQNRVNVGVLQKHPDINLTSCIDCQAVSASRMPTAKTLQEFYSGYYEENITFDSNKKVTFDITKRFSKHIINNVSHYLDNSDISILDFGGGDGSMAVQLANDLLSVNPTVLRISIMVIDYNESLVSTENAKINIDRQSEISDDLAEQYDLTIASAIIEHLPQPRETLLKLFQSVKENGVMYSRTPYMMPFIKASSVLGIEWDFHYPSHLHDLGPLFWNRIFQNLLGKENSFKIIASQPSIVETSLKKHFRRTLAAYLFKMPWYLLGNTYKMVGGWEVFASKENKLLC